MALVGFKPDYDLFDPSDPESWYGTWTHDDGYSAYGKGSPEMGEALLAENDSSPDPVASGQDDARRYAEELGLRGADGQPLIPDADREARDAGVPLAPKPKAQPASAGPQASADWASDVPAEVANDLEDQARAAGLNPEALAAVIKHESGWNPAAVNAKTGKHAGLIQFSADGWPQVAAAAGQPDVTWEQMQGMSASEQLPFVIAYYKDKGVGPESGVSDYAMRTFMPAYANEGDDFVLGEKGSTSMLGDVRSGKVYEQNEGLDLNRDGRITKGEVGESYGGKPGAPRTALTGNISQNAPQMPAGAPSSFGGLPLAQVGMNGLPQSPEQVQQAQQSVGQRYAAVVGARQQADEVRAQGAREAMALVERNHAAQTQSRDAEIQRREAAVQQANEKINREVMAPIQEVDPVRYVKTMSTGDKVMGAIGVLLSAIGQAANSMLGINTPNLAVQMLNSAIEKDIDAQKEALARGREQSGQRLAFWRGKLGSEESALEALRGEQKMSAGRLLEAQVQKSGLDAAQKAQGVEFAAQMFAEGQAAVQAIADREAQRLQLQFAPPKPVAADPAKLVETLQAAKIARQELKESGMTDAQIDATLKAAGLPNVAGDTVPQQQHKADQERAAAQHQADQARADAKLTDNEKVAEAALTTMNAYAGTTPLRRNTQTNQWEVPTDTPALGWRMDKRKERNAYQKALLEAFGRLESQGQIGPNERTEFIDMISGAWSLDELAADLNAIELIIQARRNTTRAAGAAGGIPGNWR